MYQLVTEKQLEFEVTEKQQNNSIQMPSLCNIGMKFLKSSKIESDATCLWSGASYGLFIVLRGAPYVFWSKVKKFAFFLVI